MYMPILFENEVLNDLFDMGDVRNYPSCRNAHRHDKHPMKYISNTGLNLLRTDVKETEDAYELSVAVPGIKKENAKIELNDGYLTISINENEQNEEKDEKNNFIRKEIYKGSAERSFYVGEDLKEEDIKAKMDNGILNIIVPKKKEEPKQEEKKLINIE